MSALSAALCSSLALPAAAQTWTTQAGARAELRHNSNSSLSDTGGTALSAARLSGSANAERSSVQGETRAEGEIVLDRSRQEGGSEGTALGRLSLNHRVGIELDTWSARLGYSRDRPQARGLTASDIGFGRGEQAVTDLALGWSRALSERLSLDLDASLGLTQLSGTAAGQDYRVAAASTALKYRWHETRTLTVSLGRTRQELSSNAQRTDVDSLRLRWAEQLGERSSFQLSVAQSDTLQATTLRRLACPLPVGFCQSGLVPYLLVEQPLRLRRQQLQYDVSGSWAWREATTLVASASRTLTPDTLGVSLNDAYAVSLSHGLGPNTRASVALDATRTRPAGAAELAGGRLLSLTLAAAHQIDERLTLQLQAQRRHYQRGSPDVGSKATEISISLQYLGATVPVWP